jgi:hypothetical protein
MANPKRFKAPISTPPSKKQLRSSPNDQRRNPLLPQTTTTTPPENTHAKPQAQAQISMQTSLLSMITSTAPYYETAYRSFHTSAKPQHQETTSPQPCTKIAHNAPHHHYHHPFLLIPLKIHSLTTYAPNLLPSSSHQPARQQFLT